MCKLTSHLTYPKRLQDFRTRFFWRLIRPQSHNAAGMIKKMKPQ